MKEQPTSETSRTAVVDAPRSARLPGPARVWILTALLSAFSLALHGFVIVGLPPLGAPHRVPWWVVAGLFCAAEVFVVHIQFQREAHTFSMSELPLIVGLFFLPPATVIAARLAGSAVALVLHRRQRPMKLLFNLSHFWLGSCIAALVFVDIAKLGDPLGPVGWVAAFSAALMALVVGDVMIDTAFYLLGAGLPVRTWAQMLVLGAISTGANTILALTAVLLVWETPQAAALVFGLAIMFFFSYRAYTLERQKHESLELLYEATHLLAQSPDVESTSLALLAHLRKMFKAEIAQLTLFPHGDDERALSTRVGPGSETELMTRIDVPFLSGRWITAAAGLPVVGFDAQGDRDLLAGVFLRETKDGMVAALKGETRMIGMVMVGDRRGNVETFDEEDAKAFGTIANHASVALENGRLERSLEQVSRVEEQLRHQAFHDSLTGLANRALFLDRVTHALAHRSDSKLGVLFVDLDDFKTVNDTLGHEAGDILLAIVGRRIQKCLRPGDTAARLGGDEFAILVEDIPDAVVPIRIADRINEELNAPIEVRGREMLVHASLGISVTHRAESAKELLRNADIAMYKAKAAGKGRYEVYEHDESPVAPSSSERPGTAVA